VASDKANIIAIMTKDAGHHAQLSRINCSLHGLLALAAWPQAVKRGLVEDFDKDNPGTLSLPDILKEDHDRKELTMNLSHLKELSDHDMVALASGMPPFLTSLDLSFEGCLDITDAGVCALTNALPPSLLFLRLDFLGCKKLTDASVQVLARALPPHLSELRLYCSKCPYMTRIGTATLARQIPKSLVRIDVQFRGTPAQKDFHSVEDLRAAGSRRSLETLGLPPHPSGSFSMLRFLPSPPTSLKPLTSAVVP